MMTSVGRSSDFTVLVTTFNRLDSLKRAIASIQRGTSTPHELVVVDAGSTDGTIPYLESEPSITSILQNERVGQSKALKRVWQETQGKYTCFLSDDVELVPGALDLAVKTLDKHADVGMVSLKMKDVRGPYTKQPWVHGISEYGILTCQHGVLRINLLRDIGYTQESYRHYGWNLDLTAAVLCAGFKIPFTKQISVVHHREWAEQLSFADKLKLENKGADPFAIYRERFRFLADAHTLTSRRRNILGKKLHRKLFHTDFTAVRFGLSAREVWAYTHIRFIHATDPISSLLGPFYLTQQIPFRILDSADNPYRALAMRTSG